MKLIKVAIVDDDPLQLNLLNNMITIAGDKIGYSIQSTLFESGEAFLFALEDLPDLNIVFLDIQMKDINGMEVARKIRENNQELTLVFITAFVEYALDGYSVNALDYILKPISQEKINSILNRYIDQTPTESTYILVDYQQTQLKLNLDDLLYLEAAKHQTIINLEQESLRVNLPFSHIATLVDERFIRTHRSYMVNLSHITQLSKQSVRLTNNETIPISKRLSKVIQASFVNYYRKEVFYE